MPPIPYEHWLNSGDNAWQLTAATLVGLMSVPGLVVLYGGVMQKRWSVNSMMLSFVAFAVVLIIWVLWGFKMAFGHPMGIFGASGAGDAANATIFSGKFWANFWGHPGSVLGHSELQKQAAIPLVDGFGGPAWNFPKSTLIYFQFVFAAITPILMLGAVLGRINFKAWIPFVILWSTFVYTINAFLIWGGGYFAQHGALDYSGGYVIHLAAGVSGFVAAWVIGPRLQRDREVDAPNNLLMVALGAGLLWLGWNGFNGGDPYYAGASASAAILNTNLCCAVAFLVWVMWDYITGNKPSLIGSVNGMITGLVVITPAAGYVNGWGAGAMGIIGGTLVFFALNYGSRLRPFRHVDDTLGVVFTHGLAGLAGGLMVGIFADPEMIIYPGGGKNVFDGAFVPAAGLIHGGGMTLFWHQLWPAIWVIVFSAIGTFILLKIVGLFVSLRMTEEDMEQGDLAVHGHEVYPSDVPSLGFYGGGAGGAATPAPAPAAPSDV